MTADDQEFGRARFGELGFQPGGLRGAFGIRQRQLVGRGLLVIAVEHEEGDERLSLREVEAIPLGRQRPARAGMRRRVAQLRLSLSSRLDIVIVIPEQCVARR